MSLYAFKDHFLQAFDYLGRFLRFETPGVVNVPVRATLYQSGTAVALTGTTAETTLVSVVIPGGMLKANGKIIVICTWSHTNSANNKTKRIKYGTFDFINAHVETTSATSRDFASMHQRTASSQVAFPNTNFGSSSTALLTGSIDSSVDQTLAITGQLASSGETLTLESALVEVITG